MTTVQEILPAIRKEALELAVRRVNSYGATQLSYFMRPGWNRGHVMAALVVLAREGIMYTRRKPESHPFHRPYGDKIYKIRISKVEAKKRLAKYA